jgi:hypothetical protein
MADGDVGGSVGGNEGVALAAAGLVAADVGATGSSDGDGDTGPTVGEPPSPAESSGGPGSRSNVTTSPETTRATARIRTGMKRRG